MKRIFTFLFFVLAMLCSFACAQDINGAWNGELNIQGNKLPIVFNLKLSEDSLVATMDSPMQGSRGIPTDSATFEDGALKIKINKLHLEYEGIVKSDTLIEGIFKQGMMTIPLNLIKGELVLLRPQEPKPPYPYNSEEVYFENKKEGFKLAGTFTFPKDKNKYPTVVLITGSGQQDRNEEILGHKPFLVLADYFTRNGVAVLRFDDRGFGKSAGNTKDATSKDFAIDVRAAMDYLKTRCEVDINNVGLLGHSEGGMIAFMLASEYDDVAFVVSMAGPGMRGDIVLGEQQKRIIEASGMSVEFYEKNKKLIYKIEEFGKGKSIKEIDEQLDEFIKNELSDMGIPLPSRKALLNQIEGYLSPWMQFFLKYDPTEDLRKIKCPILALNGSKDLQIIASSNLLAIKKNAPHVEVKEYENLNHLFQNCQTGLMDEYGEIEETISSVVLEDITSWILKTVDK